MNLENKFLFWPVRVHEVRAGWVFGTCVPLESISPRELLEQRRLRWRRKKGRLSDRQVEASFRHYDGLGVAMERAPLLLETFQLDEQQFTSPAAVVPESKAQQALIEFLNLPDQDEQAAVDFIKKFGCFEYSDVDDWKFVGSRIPGWLQETYQKLALEPDPQSEHDTSRKKDRFATCLEVFWAIRGDLLGLWRLSLAIEARDHKAARRQCIDRRPNSTFDPQTHWIEMAKAILRVDISIMLNSEPTAPRVFLWDNEGASVAMTMARTVRSGLYLALVSLISSRTKYGNCPTCGRAFIATAKRKKYCKHSCQNAAKAKRFRRRNRQKARKSKA